MLGFGWTKRLIPAVLLGVFLGACNWLEPIDEEPSPAPMPAENATPASIPWTIARKNPHSGIFGIAWNPTDLRHPLLTTDRVMREMYTLLFDSLFVLDQEFNAHEQLCRQIKSTDNQTFIISLRQNVSFSNGQPLTAEDVFNSIQTARSPASPYAARLSCIESVRVEGGDIEIVLNAPNPRFAALLTFPVVSAVETEFPWAGTGAYEYENDDEGRSFLKPFAGHWRKTELPLAHIELVAADKLEELTYLMGAGDISIATWDINDSFSVSFGGDFDVWEYPTSAMYYVGFNKTHPLLANSAVRQAVSSAFDRSGLAAKVFQNAADAAVLPVSPVVKESGDGFDLKLFAQVMMEMGIDDVDNDGILDFKSGRINVPLTLRFITNEDDLIAGAAARYLADGLIESGVDVVLMPLSATEYRNALTTGEYELYCEKTVLPPDFSVRRWVSESFATNSSITDEYLAFREEMPIAPLLFKREFVLTHWSEVSGILPVYGNPFANISDWTVKQ